MSTKQLTDKNDQLTAHYSACNYFEEPIISAFYYVKEVSFYLATAQRSIYIKRGWNYVRDPNVGVPPSYVTRNYHHFAIRTFEKFLEIASSGQAIKTLNAYIFDINHLNLLSQCEENYFTEIKDLIGLCPKGCSLLKLNRQISLDGLKKKYKIAYKANHPENGGSYQDLVEINRTYRLAHDFLCSDDVGLSLLPTAEDFIYRISTSLGDIYCDEWDVDNAYRIIRSLKEKDFFGSNIPWSDKPGIDVLPHLLRSLTQCLYKADRNDEAIETFEVAKHISTGRKNKNILTEPANPPFPWLAELKKTLEGKKPVRLIVNHPRQAENVLKIGLIQKPRYNALIEQFSVWEQESLSIAQQRPSSDEITRFDNLEVADLSLFVSDLVEDEFERTKTEKANAQSAIDQYELGMSYFYGQDEKQDYAKALECFRNAADQGNASAQCQVAQMYEKGEGVPQDMIAAAKYYVLAAEQKSIIAQSSLAAMYDKGMGVPQDYAEAAKWWHIIVERRGEKDASRPAAFILGLKYIKGEGVPQDYAAAIKWLRMAAAYDGYPRLEAQFELALIYDCGEGVPQDYAEALKWYSRAAKSGYADAQCRLGRMYRDGEGVPQDYAEALKWFRKAARKNNDHTVAQYFLGEMYYRGEGVPQDYGEALKWYRKAAGQGDTSAQYSLGFMYENSQGVTQDDAEAVKWYHLAAEQGSSAAQYSLGIKYYLGEGVPHAGSIFCVAEAEKWLGKAAEQGNADALDILKSIQGRGEIYDFFFALLQPKETQDYLINTVSEYVLDYCNNIYDICYGIALGELEDEVAPFFVGVLGSSQDLVWEKYEYFTEEQGAHHSDILSSLQNALTDILSDNWPLIIKKRQAKESQFVCPEEFVALRRFMVVLKDAGIDFYTKASDGAGPDIIGGTVTTDLVHSDYEVMATIEEKYSPSALKEVMKGCRDSYMFANSNFNFTGERKDKIEFFGPGYDDSFYSFINTNERKELFLEALTDLSERLSLPMTVDLKFKAREDRIVFNVAWERKLPEIFYEISNHTRDNRFS